MVRRSLAGVDRCCWERKREVTATAPASETTQRHRDSNVRKGKKNEANEDDGDGEMMMIRNNEDDED